MDKKEKVKLNYKLREPIERLCDFYVQYLDECDCYEGASYWGAEILEEPIKKINTIIEEKIDRAREEEREEIISELEGWKVAHIDRTREDGAEYLRDALIKLLTI